VMLPFSTTGGSTNERKPKVLCAIVAETMGSFVSIWTALLITGSVRSFADRSGASRGAFRVS
jgi:hypothetical protein